MRFALILAMLIIALTSRAEAGDCDIGNIFKGMTKIEIIPHQDSIDGQKITWETGIISSNGSNQEQILGKIAEPERDGSMAVTDAAGQDCGLIVTHDEYGRPLQKPQLTCDAETAECAPMPTPIYLSKAGPNAYMVMLRGNIVWGAIEGRFPSH